MHDQKNKNCRQINNTLQYLHTIIHSFLCILQLLLEPGEKEDNLKK